MKTTASALILFAVALYSQPRPRSAEYVLVLKDEPVVRIAQSRTGLQSAAARAQSVRIRQAQTGVIAELKRRQVPVTGSAELLVNAVMVSATPENAVELQNIPGVSFVMRAPTYKPDMDRAIALQNVNAAWSAVSGGAANAGAGVKIGIIDSGIDQNHAAFQDASLRPPSGFPKGETAYTNSKVIVARSYVSLVAKGFTTDPVETSKPDDYTPRDRLGHGTAIAMIAAGAQNTGPAGTIQGIAPKAFLGNYKIFGSPGVNSYSRIDAVTKALEDAFADGMDIVTLALSEGDPPQYAPLDTESACGGECDVISQAIENATAKGMVVVVSAGNGGNVGKNLPTLGSIHTPGTAPSAITVGATVNSHVFYNTLRVPGFRDLRALFTDGPRIAAARTAPIRDAGQACAALAAGSMSGAIALIPRDGACTFTDKMIHAQNAGAVGVVFYELSGQETISGSLGVQSSGIPSMMLGNTDGLALKGYVSSNGNASATMDPALAPVESSPDAVWAASSRGPSPGSFGNVPIWAVKPELVAVGANIYTATQKLDPNSDAYNAAGYTSVTGTSYAVPMVAGAVALVKQKFPQMTPAQLKSAVVNTASTDVTDADGRARANSAGAGKLDAGRAMTVAATLNPSTISFGRVASTTADITRTVQVFNHGSTTAIFNLRVQQRDLDPAARFSSRRPA
jgi:subtilisin family serine protease